MLILGFESSCDETAAAVLRADENGRFTVLSDVIASQVDIHRLYGGVVPEIASRAHTEAISRITYRALEDAGVALSDIDLIAVTDHPGLIGALLCAVNFAKALAAANGIPLVGVDHIRGHIAASYLVPADAPRPEPPFLAMVTSGGHTAVYCVADYTDVRMIGTTRDDAIGESFDKIGRLLGIPYPAGKGFDALSAEGFRAATGAEDDDFVALYQSKKIKKDPLLKLPSPAIPGDTLDFSFSGLKTAAINVLHRYEQSGAPFDRAAFAAAYTAAAVHAVGEKILCALGKYPGYDLVLAGGVAANSHLRRRLAAIAAEKGVRFFVPPLSLCGDNAAMIAAQGYYEAAAGNYADSSLNASAADDPLPRGR